MLKVSVITAVRNGGATIRSTLASLASQSYPEIEHVVADGASSDDTVAIIRELGSRDLRLSSEADRGVYDAFNKGLSLATGDVIGFLNCGDTYSSNDVLARVMERFSDPAIEGVFGDLMIVDAENTSVGVRRYRSSNFTPARLAYGLMPAHPTLFLRRSVYDTFGGYDPSFRIAGDFEFVARIFAQGGIRYCCFDDVLVRMPRGGLSTSGPRATWIITREKRRACRMNGISTNYVKLVSRVVFKLTEFVSLRT